MLRTSRTLARIPSTCVPSLYPIINKSFSTAVIKPDEPQVQIKQSPNRNTTWSAHQESKSRIITGLRFEQTDLAAQPNSLAAIELINAEPIRYVEARRISCDGGGSLGHPRIFINLDQDGPHACGYCGLRYERTGHGHDHH